MIDAAERTNEECGDGTTTATIIGNFILSEGIKYIKAGDVNPVELRRGIQKAVEAICVELDSMA